MITCMGVPATPSSPVCLPFASPCCGDGITLFLTLWLVNRGLLHLITYERTKNLSPGASTINWQLVIDILTPSRIRLCSLLDLFKMPLSMGMNMSQDMNRPMKNKTKYLSKSIPNLLWQQRPPNLAVK